MVDIEGDEVDYDFDDFGDVDEPMLPHLHPKMPSLIILRKALTMIL